MNKYLPRFALAVMLCFMGGVAFADQGNLVASKNSDKYHLATCPVAKQIIAANRIEFKTPEEAIKAGYSPCQKCNPSKKSAAFVGSKNSAVYHLPTCRLAKNISADNLVNFSSKAEAQKAGYKPCQICFPSDIKIETKAATKSVTKVEKKTTEKIK